MQRPWGRHELVIVKASWKGSVARAECTSRRQGNAVRASIVVTTILIFLLPIKLHLFLWTLPSVYVGVCLGSVLDFIIPLSSLSMTLIGNLSSVRQRPQGQSQFLSWRPVNWGHEVFCIVS